MNRLKNKGRLFHAKKRTLTKPILFSQPQQAPTQSLTQTSKHTDTYITSFFFVPALTMKCKYHFYIIMFILSLHYFLDKVVFIYFY